jgi:hypothetical protein
MTANGDNICAPRAMVNIEILYLSGKFVAILLNDPPADLIVDNVDGARPPSYNELGYIAAVETRWQRQAIAANVDSLGSALLDINITPEEFKQHQLKDSNFSSWWTEVTSKGSKC